MIFLTWAFPDGSEVKNLIAKVQDVGDAGSISGLGRYPGEGNGNPLQYSCLENPMDRGAWTLAGYNPWSCKKLEMTD